MRYFNTLFKVLVKNNFNYFIYFFSYLKYRIFISFFLSMMVGFLDGLGISMFIPLFQLVSGNMNEGVIVSMGEFQKLIMWLKQFQLQIDLKSILIVMVIFFTIKGFFKYLEGLSRVRYEQFFITSQRKNQIKLLSQFSYDSFVKTSPGRIQNSLSSEVERVTSAYKNFFVTYQHGILIIVYFTMAFLANPEFAILLAGGGIITTLLLRGLVNATKRLSNKLTINSNSFQGQIIEFVNFYKYLKATGKITLYKDILFRQIRKISNSNFRIGVITNFITSVKEPLIISVVAFVIYIEVYYLGEGISTLILSLLLFYRALSYIMGYQSYWNQFLIYSGSLLGNEKFIKDLTKGKEYFGTKEIQNGVDEIYLQNISVNYGSMNSVLSNLSIRFNKKKTFAIIGESGSGKTTIINLITGLVKPSSGKVFINGNDIEDLNLNQFRNKVGYITQDSIIFNDSLFNNITLWDELNDINLKKCWDVINRTALNDFVTKLSLGINTILGANGIDLSGGQKQRICIARELYKSTNILIFDEATSALDSETEQLIQNNIDELHGSLMIIIITHRLATIKNVDLIYYIDKGQLLGEGNFDDLKKTSLYFNKIVALQNVK